MILVDMNQISVASVMMHLHMTKKTKPEEDMVRHMILNSLRMYRMKFCDEYGELVLCYDSKHYWRRDYYPEYKHSRKKGRETSSNDWDAIFEVLNAIKAELKEFFPYKHLEVYGAEADDIIAALCGELEFDNGKTLILSGDTVVAAGRRILPKAETAEEARACLTLLSGRRHRVLSAITLIDATGHARHRLSTSIVIFKRLERSEIDRYIASGEGLGKAGGYAIQGWGAVFVSQLHGSYSAVVGLPLCETAQLLDAFGLARWTKASR